MILRHRMSFGSLTTICLALAVAAPARADIIDTFNANGTFAGGAALGGTVGIDMTTGAVVSPDLTVAGFGPAFTVVSVAGDQSGVAYVSLLQSASVPFDVLTIGFGVGSLASYAGGALNSDVFVARATPSDPGFVTGINGPLLPDSTVSGGPYSLQSGSLTLASAVPEPASIALLGLGALGAAMIGSRRSRTLRMDAAARAGALLTREQREQFPAPAGAWPPSMMALMTMLDSPAMPPASPAFVIGGGQEP